MKAFVLQSMFVMTLSKEIKTNKHDIFIHGIETVIVLRNYLENLLLQQKNNSI